MRFSLDLQKHSLFAWMFYDLSVTYHLSVFFNFACCKLVVFGLCNFPKYFKRFKMRIKIVRIIKISDFDTQSSSNHLVHLTNCGVLQVRWGRTGKGECLYNVQVRWPVGSLPFINCVKLKLPVQVNFTVGPNTNCISQFNNKTSGVKFVWFLWQFHSKVFHRCMPVCNNNITCFPYFCRTWIFALHEFALYIYVMLVGTINELSLACCRQHNVACRTVILYCFYKYIFLWIVL